MTSLMVRKVRGRKMLRLVPVVHKVISEGVVKLERVLVICPACRQPIEAIARDGRVKGYCAFARQTVDFLVETPRVDKNPTAETRAKISASVKKRWQDPEYRAKMSATQKKRWQDPEYRAKQIATHTGKHPTAETRAKMSATARRHNKSGIKTKGVSYDLG